MRTSAWVPLEQGKHYYIEGDHQEGGGSDHFGLAVEVEQATLNAAHPKTTKEVQLLTFNTEDIKETSVLTIVNPDDGTFRLTFMSTGDDIKRVVSEEMKANMSASKITNAIKGYY